MLSLYASSINEGNYEMPIVPEEHTEVTVVTPKYREVSVVVTAYSKGDDNTPGDTMANGEKVHQGAIAYNDAPLGTKVVIDGNEYTVKDRMKYNGYIDIYMDDIVSANEWGVQRKTVKVRE